MNDDFQAYSGHPVIDRHGTEVGTITDVVYDEITEEPTWGVVSPGMLHARHYIPLSPPVYLDTGGSIVVPYDKADVLRCTQVHPQPCRHADASAQLEHHYSLVG